MLGMLSCEMNMFSDASKSFEAFSHVNIGIDILI